MKNKKIVLNDIEYDFEDWMEGKTDDEIISLQKWIFLLAYFRWFPDKFYDIISPKKGGIKLNLYQRVMLRVFARFPNAYFILPRGSVKTHSNIMGEIHEAIFYPNIDTTLTAETKEQGAKILKDKFVNEILRQFPAIQNELADGKKATSFGKDYAEINFRSGGKIDTLANNQSSKGLRRHKLRIEEAARLNNELYEDVLQPIPKTTTRRTAGKSIINPEESHGGIHFFTTSTYRGCDEHKRVIQMIREMAENKGSFVFSADYRLPVQFGLLTQSAVDDAERNSNYINFAMNYLSEWVGAAEDAVIDMQMLNESRNILCASIEPEKNREYIIAVDVAQSQSESANKTVFEIIGFDRKEDGSIKNIWLEMIITPKNGKTYEAQSLALKRLANVYKPKKVVIDGQSYGRGLIEALTKPIIDPYTNKKTERWCISNNDDVKIGYDSTSVPDSNPIIYAVIATGANQTNIIINFQGNFMSGKVKLLCDSNNMQIPKDILKDSQKSLQIEQAHLSTSVLIEEVANLKIVHNTNGTLKIQQMTRAVDKDRFSALAYGLFYINKEENKINNQDDGYDYVFYS